MPLAVPELIWFAILLFSFAVVYTLRKFIEGLFNPLISALGHVPGVGSWLSGVLRSIEQSVSHALGAAEAGIDAAIGASFHELARLTEWLWREFKAHSLLFAVAATIIGELVHGYRRLTHAVHDVTRSLTHTLHRVEAQERRLLHGIDRLDREITRVEHGIGHDVLPRIRSLDREVTKLADRVIPSIRSIAQGAEHDVAALRKWVTDNALISGTAAFAGAVAAALATLGLGWLRCDSNPFNNNRNACGLWSILGRVLSLAGFLAAAFDFRAFVAAAEIVAAGIGDAVVAIEGTFDLALPPLPPPQD